MSGEVKEEEMVIGFILTLGMLKSNLYYENISNLFHFGKRTTTIRRWKKTGNQVQKITRLSVKKQLRWCFGRQQASSSGKAYFCQQHFQAEFCRWRVLKGCQALRQYLENKLKTNFSGNNGKLWVTVVMLFVVFFLNKIRRSLLWFHLQLLCTTSQLFHGLPVVYTGCLSSVVESRVWVWCFETNNPPDQGERSEFRAWTQEKEGVMRVELTSTPATPWVTSTPRMIVQPIVVNRILSFRQSTPPPCNNTHLSSPGTWISWVEGLQKHPLISIVSWQDSLWDAMRTIPLMWAVLRNLWYQYMN